VTEHFRQKAAHKMLVKLTPGVYFTNILFATFIHADPKSINIQSSCQYLFALWGSVLIKALHKMLVKLTPEYIASYIQFIATMNCWLKIWYAIQTFASQLLKKSSLFYIFLSRKLNFCFSFAIRKISYQSNSTRN